MLRASRKVSGRVLSTITMKPRLPSDRISHMKSKRFWPGVPNRYSTRSSSTVIRPKSIATVVVSLTRSASDEILRSVDTTSISLMVRMNSVLPAEKGPVTTIFTVSIIARRSLTCEISNAAELNLLDAVDQPIDDRTLDVWVDRYWRGHAPGRRSQRDAGRP